MAKGSIRKKGKKWYYRFYVEDASGNFVQKECARTESKNETEKLLRQAMEDYESKKFIAKADNITLGQLLDTWAEEGLKTGTLSNYTVGTYLQAINRIKQHPVSRRKLKTVTSGHLQQFMDLLSFGGTVEDFVSKRYSIDYIRSYSAVLQQSFRFAVFPKQYITFNPMQYVVMRHKKDDMDLFAEETDTDTGKVKPISYEQYQKLTAQLGKRSKDAILPVQIAYFTGLRLGEVAGLTWQDINLEEQYLTVRRSVRYNGATHKHEIGSTKREDGCLELPATVETACRTAARKVPELEGFHFHTLRHTYTTSLLSNGAQPKDVQELLVHSDVSTTMNVYAHATREAKRDFAKLLDQVVGMN